MRILSSHYENFLLLSSQHTYIFPVMPGCISGQLLQQMDFTMWHEFEKFLDRHGEIGVQAILEKWEQREGVRFDNVVPLAHRWAVFYQGSAEQQAA